MPSKFTSKIGAKFLPVEAGSCKTGSPASEHGRHAWEEQIVAAIPHSFFLSRTPITHAQYESLTGENPTAFPAAGDDAPADSISWQDANEFSQKLTSIDLEASILPPGWEYRLPTEAEWEYCCRAGTNGARYGELEAIAWFASNSNNSTHPVAQKAPNAWGFHDLIGNVWEMCLDWFDRSNEKRAVRGGSFFNTESFCRAATREGYNGGRYCGFRLVASEKNTAKLGTPTDEIANRLKIEKGPTLYSAILNDDFGLAEEILEADSAAIESQDEIPPPVHWCIYNDRPEMLKLLLEKGADIERLEQDHGATPLRCAVVMRHMESMQILVEHGADTGEVLSVAERGAAGEFEKYGLDREGYLPVIARLRQLLSA